MLDIDFFKRVNDSYGHQAGDAVLAQMAKIIKGEVRDFDGSAVMAAKNSAYFCLPELKRLGRRPKG